MTRSVRDSRLLMEVIVGITPRESLQEPLFATSLFQRT
jgi:Asp-tRNA(Asn)/Glu-tRNA(Gln) amidotransferase A subunit family amidase